MNATISLEKTKHYPVMLNQVLSIISPQHGGTYIDCTFGGGGYSKLILEQNPDIISGYNIYSFDFPYIWDRAVELGILEKYRILGKFKNRKSMIKEKILASSALGHNSWREIDTVGRIQVDLLKVIQRDHNLQSYKLDNVSSHFMKGKITGFPSDNKNQNVIITDNTKGLPQFINPKEAI